jgi:acyl-coenzyme A thioesterase PaaI-like protein
VRAWSKSLPPIFGDGARPGTVDSNLPGARDAVIRQATSDEQGMYAIHGVGPGGVIVTAASQSDHLLTDGTLHGGVMRSRSALRSSIALFACLAACEAGQLALPVSKTTLTVWPPTASDVYFDEFQAALGVQLRAKRFYAGTSSPGNSPTTPSARTT